MHTIVSVAIFLAISLTLTLLQPGHAGPTVASTTLQKNFPDIAQAAVSSYHAQKINHQARMTSPYLHYGDYLDYGKTKQFTDSNRVRLDSKGLP